jgi:hypothetical protein
MGNAARTRARAQARTAAKATGNPRVRGRVLLAGGSVAVMIALGVKAAVGSR